MFGECLFSTPDASIEVKGLGPQPFPLLPSIKDKQSKTLVRVVKTDFNHKCTIAIGKRIQHELNSTWICSKITGPYLKREWKGLSKGLVESGKQKFT